MSSKDIKQLAIKALNEGREEEAIGILMAHNLVKQAEKDAAKIIKFRKSLIGRFVFHPMINRLTHGFRGLATG